MKERPEVNKESESDDDEDEILDGAGYKNIPTVGVSQIKNMSTDKNCDVLKGFL